MTKKEFINKIKCFFGEHVYKARVWDACIDYICQNCDYIRTIHYHSYGYGDIKPVNDEYQLYDSELRRTGKYFNS